jgi:HEAT repeat protein
MAPALAGQHQPKFERVSESTPSNVEQAREIIKSGFDSKDYQVRIEAVTAAGMVGRNEVLLSRLVDLLNDKNVDVRLATVHAISDLHTEKCEQSLEKTVAEDPAPEVAFAAAKVLASWRDSAGTQALMEVYDGTRKTRSNIISKEKRTLLEQFHSYPSAMMFVLSKGVGYVPVPGAGEGFSAITTLLKDPGLSDRASVLLILCRGKNKQSRVLLAKALKDDNWSVRAVATQIISQTAQTDFRSSLPPLFEDKNDKVRFRAAGAYLHLELVRQDKILQGKVDSSLSQSLANPSR